MLSKSRHPHKNRHQRRHPEKYEQHKATGANALPWLLWGLLTRGGYVGSLYEAINPIPAPRLDFHQRKPGKSWFGKAVASLRKVFG